MKLENFIWLFKNEFQHTNPQPKFINTKYWEYKASNALEQAFEIVSKLLESSRTSLPVGDQEVATLVT